jgi:hypothetical protein
MGNQLLVVADLGLFKAIKAIYDGAGPSPRLELVKSFETDGHRKWNEILTDVPGKFAGGNGALGGEAMSSGENHHLKQEYEKRILEQLACELDELLCAHSDCDECYLAMSKPMHHEFLRQLSPQTREKVTIDLAENLTKFGDGAIYRHFIEHKRSVGTVPILNR